MRWPADAAGWPHRDLSRLTLCRPHRWHIQEAGTGPTLLLIHGAGGATQSFRGLLPILAETHHVIAVDLPGQGFTQLGARQRCGLGPMTEDLLTLIRREGWKPEAVIGHSAGAAIALHLWELGHLPRTRIFGINAALGKFRGVAGWLFPMMAKVLALNPFTANLFAGSVTPSTVARLIEGTGSHLDDTGLRLYQRLASDRGHVDGTLAMMSQWQLDGLLSRLPGIDCPVTLITGARDTAVPPETSRDAAARLPRAEHVTLEDLGHLAHEEDPGAVARVILDRL